MIKNGPRSSAASTTPRVPERSRLTAVGGVHGYIYVVDGPLGRHITLINNDLFSAFCKPPKEAVYYASEMKYPVGVMSIKIKGISVIAR